MNNLEFEYSKKLELEKIAGEVIWYRFEGIKFRLADATFYEPDFIVMKKDLTLEIHETKGFWTDDARAKTKIAAELYPVFRFIALKKQSKKLGGGWVVEEF